MEKETKKQTTKKTNSAKKNVSSAKKTTNAKKAASTKKAATAPVKKNAPAKKQNTNKKVEQQVKEEKVVEEVKLSEKEVKSEVPAAAKAENSEITNLIKMVIIVTVVFLAFYLITWLITKSQNKEEKPTETEVSISYSDILLGNLLDQTKNDYYVLAYEKDDLYASTYNMLIGTYTRKEGSLKFYYSDLTLKFNEKYYDVDAEESELRDYNNLKLKTTTLFKVSNKQIVDSREGSEAILDYLSEISK